MGNEEARLREDIPAEELLNRQLEGLKNMLWRLLVFEVGVPEDVFSVAYGDISEVEQHRRRVVQLGTLEVSDFHGDGLLSGAANSSEVITADEIPHELVEKAIQALYKVRGS